MSFRPTENRIFVRMDPLHEKKVGSLILPQTRKHVTYRGTVTAVGPKCERLKEGDRVLFVHVVGVKANLPENDDLPELQNTIILHEPECLAAESGHALSLVPDAQPGELAS